MRNQNYLHNLLTISHLRFKALNLTQNCLLVGLPISELKVIDNNLILLFKSLIQYDFYKNISNSKALFVGEGNLSFILSLVSKFQHNYDITASTFENYNGLSDLGKNNAKTLLKHGINILHEVDATKLDHFFKNQFFDSIIFQFPHTGSREAIDGCNSNYILVRDFIKSALKHLAPNGKIIITIVDNDFYNNLFQLKELANLLGLKPPIKYKFIPEEYSGYKHSMTNEDESAIDKYMNFATWEFKL